MMTISKKPIRFQYKGLEETARGESSEKIRIYVFVKFS
jgi:hypothetical protein